MTAPKPLPVDHAERELALDPAQSFIVQAPAGSGKTELLVRRYLTLLQYVDNPESIVAITFTKKAASEMQRRVLDEIRKAESDRARTVLERDRAKGWQLLDNPSRLRIRTIDSFCLSLAQQMPWMSGFGGQPSIIDDASDLYRQAARSTLAQLDSGHPWAQSIERLLHHLDNNFKNIEDMLVEMLGRRDQWLRLIIPGFDRATLEANLREFVSHRLDEVRRVFPMGFEATLPGDDLPAWLDLVKKYLTNDGDLRDKVAKKLNVERFSPEMIRFAEELHSVRQLPAPHYDDNQWEVLLALTDLLKVATGQLLVAFQEASLVDFTEVSQRALRALGTAEAPTDLAYSLDYRIQHLLVDEFQDTSFSQYRLLERLTAGWENGDGRSLFVVGDPMQSIYRFREADVGLFLKTRAQGLGDLRLKSLALKVNFRSQQSIVDWVNQTFPGILAQHEDQDTGAVPYSSSEAYNPPLEGEAIHVYPFSERQDEAEAQQVVEIVKASKEAGKTAILVRVKHHAVKIAAQLSKAGIRFRAVDLESLAEKQVVLDLVALTRAMLSPADRTAWLAVLRAPWSAMTLAELLAVPENPAMAAPPALLKSLENRARVPLRRWVEETWMALGGPACVKSQTDLEDADAFFELLELHSQGAELANMDLFIEKLKKLFARPDVEADDTVQILSLHKSKGLQFDTVILPGLGRRGSNDSQQLLTRLEIGGRLFVAPIKETGEDQHPINQFLRSVESQKARYELSRLLYVAVTRAKKTLHLLGHVNAKGNADAGSLLRCLWDSIGGHFTGLAPKPDAGDQARPAIAVRKFAAGWQLPAPPPAVDWGEEDHVQLAAEERPVTFDWASDTLRHAGTVVHRMMQRIARDGVDTWSDERLAEWRPYFLSSLATLGVPPSESADAAARVERALVLALSDPHGRWVLSRHEDEHSELQLTGLDRGKLFSGTVDRTFADQGIRWIVDFKTSSHEGGAVDEFLDNELRRYRPQLERYASLFAALDDRPIRLGLYFPLLRGWREWSPSFRDQDDRLSERERAAHSEP